MWSQFSSITFTWGSNLPCQLYIQCTLYINPPHQPLAGWRITADIYLDASLREYLDQMNWGGKTHPQCEQQLYVPLWQDKHKEEDELRTSIHLPLLPACECPVSRLLMLFQLLIPLHNGLFLPNENLIYSPFSKYFCLGFCHSSHRSSQYTR